MRKAVFFFVLFLVCSSLLANPPIESQLVTLQSNIQLKLQESQKQLQVMETQLRYLQQTSQTERQNLETRLTTFQSSWNNTLIELKSCYNDINTLNDTLTKERTKNSLLTRWLIVGILLILIPIIAKIVIKVLQIKGFAFPSWLTFWL